MKPATQTHSLFTQPALRLIREQSKPLPISPEVGNTMLNALLAAKLLFEANEALSHTTFYRQELKALLIRLQRILEPLVNEDYGALIESDALARLTFNVEDHYKVFIKNMQLKKFVRHSPSLLAGLGYLIQAFHEDPAMVLDRNGIKIQEAVE